MFSYTRKSGRTQDDFFDALFGDLPLPRTSFYLEEPQIPAEISNTDDGTAILLDVPGVKKEDITIDYSDNKLSITAKRGDNTRSWQRELTDNADQDNITAHLEDGVLEVTIPRLEKKIIKKIEIT